MACATAAAVNGAIAEGAIFEAAKGKEGITEVLKSAVVDPPVKRKRTRMATRALHRGEDDGKRPKTCGVGNGARHRTDNSSGSMTSRPLTGGESNGLADIHNLQVDVRRARGLRPTASTTASHGRVSTAGSPSTSAAVAGRRTFGSKRRVNRCTWGATRRRNTRRRRMTLLR